EVRLAELPLTPGVEAVARAAGRDPRELAATAGDDYELLFTAPPESRGQIEAAARQAGSRVTWLGDVAAGSGLRLLRADGAPARPRRYHGRARPSTRRLADRLRRLRARVGNHDREDRGEHAEHRAAEQRRDDSRGTPGHEQEQVPRRAERPEVELVHIDGHD